MIDLRDMELMLAVSRHRHFARAADEIGLSQPALSMRIRKLEQQLGAVLIKRGNRFQGFTAEGDIVLRHARQLLDDARAMRQELRSVDGELSGTLNIAAIPSALGFAARIPQRLAAAHPLIKMRLHSASSLAIQQGIEDGVFDAGISYEDGVRGEFSILSSLYLERYVLAVPADLAPRKSGTATWAEAASLPLSLLIRQMQNRRIIDGLFEDLGQSAQIVAEANAFSTCLIHAREGFAATIVPEILLDTTDLPAHVVTLNLAEPDVTKNIGLIAARRAAELPTILALRQVLDQQSDK